MSIERLNRYFEGSAAAARAFLAAQAESVCAAGERIRDALASGHKLLVCGNGGSAADAQHLAAEIACRFETERRALPAIALGGNTSALTAWSNDYSYDTAFAREVEAFAHPGDVLIAISTSGNSKSVVEAVRAASKLGVYTIGLLGKDGGRLAGMVDAPIVVPSDRTAHIQECHLVAYHFWCEMIDG